MMTAYNTYISSPRTRATPVSLRDGQTSKHILSAWHRILLAMSGRTERHQRPKCAAGAVARHELYRAYRKKMCLECSLNEVIWKNMKNCQHPYLGFEQRRYCLLNASVGYFEYSYNQSTYQDDENCFGILVTLSIIYRPMFCSDYSSFTMQIGASNFF